MSGAKYPIVAISAATGTCYAALAGMAMAAMAVPVRSVHAASPVIAAVAIFLGYLAFRAAIAGPTDGETWAAALRRGMIAALVALLAMFALILMFKTGTQAFLAHALGRPASSFTPFRLLIAAVLMGFGTGFACLPPPAARATSGRTID